MRNERAEAPAVERAMILAAGFGTRLRPLTERLPKPLVPLLGRPLLEWIARSLCGAGVHHIAINAHHLPDELARGVERLAQDLARGPCPGASPRPDCEIALYREAQILGTGGALANARAFLEQDAQFLVHNGDVLTDLDLAWLAAAHVKSGALATLALVDWPAANTVLLSSEGVVVDINGRHGAEPARGRALCYTGVAMLSRGIFRYLPETGYASLIEALLTALVAEPGSVRGLAPGDVYWNDLGTIERLLDAHRDVLLSRRLVLAEVDPPQDGVFLGPGARVAKDARLNGFVSLGREACVRSGARLDDCIVFDDTTVAAGPAWRRAVLGPGWAVTQDENEIPHLPCVRAAGFGAESRIEPLVEHGSDRGFWRLRAADRAGAAKLGRDGPSTLVLMRTAPTDPELPRFVAVGRFLHEQGLGGPAIVADDPATGTVLMEDLGDESLYQAVRRERARLPALHRTALELLVALQTRGTVRLDRCPLAGDRLFDHATLRWESDYFRQRFLRDVASVPEAVAAALDEEFERLAQAALAQPIVLMHRDFQSQNILLVQGRPRLIDFQGMRRGPLLYDVMSLLRDPYLDPTPAERAPLLEGWRDALAAAGGPVLAPNELRRHAAVAGLQRNLQALGAYAFLSRVQGKAEYVQWIPAGLRQLEDGLTELRACDGPPGPLPRLEAVVAKVRSGGAR